MVVKIRYWLLPLICLANLMLPIQAHAKFPVAKLTVTTDSPQIQLGKYLTLYISYQASKPIPVELNKIDTSALDSHFHVEKNADVSLDEEKYQYFWKLRLYPYATGSVTIPKLNFNGHESESWSIEVIDPVDLKTGLPIKVEHKISNTNPWAREQIQFLTTLNTKVDIRQLKIDEMNNSKLTLVQLENLQSKATTQEHNVYKVGWAASAHKNGQIKLNLPPVNLIRDGVTTHLFYPPPIELNVKSLPVYVPTTIPVGKISIANLKKQYYLFQDSLSSMDFTLIGEGLTEASLPDITRQFSNNQRLRFYPKQTSTSINFDKRVARTNTAYRIPIKVLEQGIINIPTIKLIYFDPVSGTLKTSQYEAIRFFSISPGVFYVLSTLLIISFIWLALKFVKYSFRSLHKFVRIKNAINNFRQVKTRNELRQAMRQACYAHGYTQNLTPMQWLSYFKTRFYKNPSLASKLNQLFYQTENGADSIPALAKQLEEYYKQSVPVLRWF